MNRKADTHLSDIRQYFLDDVIKRMLILSIMMVPFFYFTVNAIMRFYMQENHLVFMLVFLDAISLCVFLDPIVNYIKLMNSIERRWPTEEEKERLGKSFAEAVSTFNDKVKISKDYTFMVMGRRIVETKQILSFRSESRSRSVSNKGDSYVVFEIYIVAILQDQESGSLKKVDILKVGEDKKYVVGKANALIREATRVLRTKIQE